MLTVISGQAIICSNSSQADLSSATDKSSSEPTTGRGGGEFGTGGSVIAVVFGGGGLSFFFRPNRCEKELRLRFGGSHALGAALAVPDFGVIVEKGVT
jgi:hypothetical protein